MNTETPWWQTFYDANLADMLLEQTSPEEIARAAGFLTDVLALPAGAAVFDQCCGSGRLAGELADRGFAVCGIDLIPEYIRRARERSWAGTGTARFAVADAFEFTADPLCDGAFNWWTSFGYADDDETNTRMLRRARESLRPGARFALDFMNVPGLYRHFLPHVVTRNAGVTLIRESTLDLASSVIRKQWTYFLPDGRSIVHHSAVRLYDPAALRSLFTAAGFVDIRFYGDTDASPLSLNSPRCIVTAINP